ncbi:hypothetical protein [Oricola nitratireducens]|uniref:hypothetical protein n=1 Tax=Oricola nitratireducens TaxID=2775868 RepID=UPI001868E89D|nr:hypothetical protein [Oricola nitratireducens]
MRAGTFAVSLLFLAISAAGSRAGPITDYAQEAERLLGQGDPIGAVTALDKAMGEIWSASPLVFRKVLFVEDSDGFGIYRPRDSSVFKPGEPLVIYAEPIGFGYGKHSIGGNEIGLVSDFILTDPDGKELFSKDDFLAITLPVRYHNREFQMQLTVSLSGLPAGEYVAKFHVRDQHSDKSGDFELPFELAE